MRRRKAKRPAQPDANATYDELYRLAERGEVTWVEAARRAGVSYMDRPSDPYRHLRQQAGYDIEWSTDE